jgi:hypothetical protein
MAGESITEKIDNLDLEGTEDGKSGGTEDKGADSGKRGDSPDAAGRDKPNDEGGARKTAASDDGGAGKAEGDAADDDEGYIADELEADEDEDPKDEPQPPGPGLNPELKYIVDNLPTIPIRGRTTPNGAIKTFNVKAATQLPDTFEFATPKEQALFNQALAAQENKAQQLQNEFRGKEQQRQAEQYTAQENADIREDLAALQREGMLPKFRANPNDKGFDADEGVKAAQEVLDFMNKKNSDYAQAGRLYRVTFRDAYEMMERQASRNEQRGRQRQEDNERGQVNRQLRGGGSAPGSTLQRARPAGSMQELLDRIELMD